MHESVDGNQPSWVLEFNTKHWRAAGGQKHVISFVLLAHILDTLSYIRSGGMAEMIALTEGLSLKDKSDIPMLTDDAH